MSIMDKIFGNRATAPVAPVQKQPGNFPANPEITADPNNPNLPNGASHEGSKKEPSPMEAFAELFKIDPAKVPPAPKGTFEGLDPAKIHEAAKTNDFRKLVTPEMQAALVKGGPEAVNVMVDMVNAMSQKSFGDSSLAATKLIERSEKAQEERLLAKMQELIKSSSRNENLASANPLFTNPAAAPMMNMISSQVAQKYPELSAADQSKMVQDYALQFAEAANPQKKLPQGVDAKGNKTDWSDFFDEV